ncbi:CidA/LrgA family protein [Lichenibacterium ramalinae]|uniref:CidA/LrgA family protein n=1 Tax=Lichenibacterium ramalinae TaxID=2316527 RepID=A0A4Q2RBN6_9HYPH|nr:CidA/LrgA family protein [Lichenibacterium ramalinae]RYB03118.1 CidA/LrgA family protein [Lichenibacterium ramalinae]
MVLGFAILLVCQLVGEMASRGFGLPVPGPVLGLVLLVLGLAAWGRGRPDAEVRDSAVARVGDGLLANLGLLFVPAGVGVIQYGGLLRAQALPLALALVGSTALTLVVTVLVFVGVSRLVGHRPSDEAPRGEGDLP